MIPLTKRCEDFTDDNTRYYGTDITKSGDIIKTIALKNDGQNKAFNFPICNHHEHNTSFELPGDDCICICGCFECVYDRGFTWGSSSQPSATCLTFSDHEQTITSTCGPSNNPGKVIGGVFPCNGSVYGRELTDEELVIKIINRLEWQYIQEIDNITAKTWLLKDISSIKKSLPERCFPLLRKVLGNEKYDRCSSGYSQYIVTSDDITLFSDLAQISVQGTLSPFITIVSDNPKTEWEKSRVREAQARYWGKEMKKAINVLDEKEQLCVNVFKIIETIQNDISRINYIKLCNSIKEIYDL
jgi:hypothetical protein